MAGIRVNTPRGPGWEYSLNNLNWQESRVFMNQVDGSAFVVGNTYQVYCRNQIDKLLAVNSIIFGLATSDDTIPVSLSIALQNGSNTKTMPYFEGGIQVDLQTIPDAEAIQLVSVGADGTFYKLDTDAKLNALFLKMIKTVKPGTPAQAALCEATAQCLINSTVTHRFRILGHYQFVSGPVTPPTLDPSYIGRYDINDCTEFSGWFIDINNPNSAPTIRIERDGVVIARVTATRLRDDVRLALIAQGKIPASTSFTTYGWVYTKQASDKDGLAHTFKAFGGTSQTVATTDGGISAVAPPCGSTVVNPPATNNPPRIVGVYPDQVVTANGDQLLASIEGLFADDDALTYTATMANGDPLMAGIVFTPGNAKPFKIEASFPNQQQPIKLIATDTARQSTPKLFLLTVARPVVTGDPVTVVSRALGGDTETIEGNGARVKVINTMSNGAQSDYTGGGTYRIIAPYPDQMTISTERDAVGVITTKETVVADVQVTIEFTSNEGWKVTGPFTIRNKTVATSPVTEQIINDIIVVEGGSGIVQLYDVHADGTWSEVTNSTGGKFEFVGLYPNGMTITYGNTGRATVTTAGNSVTADVNVQVRYTPASGNVVNGIVTVRNQSDPENPTPFIEKFAVYVKQLTTAGVNTYVNIELIYKTNLPVGTQIEDLWPEIWAVTNQQPEWLPSNVTPSSVQFPDGFKDYNVEMLYTTVPASFFQSHTVHHVKVRQKDTTTILLDTTFDLFGLSVGQTKTFFPL